MPVYIKNNTGTKRSTPHGWQGMKSHQLMPQLQLLLDVQYNVTTPSNTTFVQNTAYVFSAMDLTCWTSRWANKIINRIKHQKPVTEQTSGGTSTIIIDIIHNHNSPTTCTCITNGQTAVPQEKGQILQHSFLIKCNLNCRKIKVTHM